MISILGAGPPDLALVDITLTGPMDGIEVTLLLRRRFNPPAIPLSASATPETMDHAKSATPLGLLEKPFRSS